jgi:hypothetical protein
MSHGSGLRLVPCATTAVLLLLAPGGRAVAQARAKDAVVPGGELQVWHRVTLSERLRYDCSGLDQWEIVFSQMDALGLMLHVVQEQENDQLLDGGALGPERKLCHRELVARFSHHFALVRNLGEENTNADAERRAFASFIRGLDPYDHPIVVHTFPSRKEHDRVYALAEAGEVYAVYLRPPWSTRGTTLDLGPWTCEYDVRWYDTRRAGALVPGSVARIAGPGPQALGAPQSDPDRDWVVLARRAGRP